MKPSDDTDEPVDWTLLHQQRKQARLDKWLKVLPQLHHITLIKHIEADLYVIHLPQLGKCDFSVKSDKIKVVVKDETRVNAYKLILNCLGLYELEGQLLKKDISG